MGAHLFTCFFRKNHISCLQLWQFNHKQNFGKLRFEIYTFENLHRKGFTTFANAERIMRVLVDFKYELIYNRY